MRYRIKNITHSGRKGIRGERVKDYKYDALFDAVINEEFTINSVKQFEQLKWVLVDNQMYDWWTTSEVIQLQLSHNNTYIIETVDAIYELEEVE